MLDNWSAFKGRLAEIKRAEKHIHKAKQSIQMAAEHLKALFDSHFFIAYPKFDKTAIHFNKTHAHVLDQDNEFMKEAVEGYFFQLFNGNPNCPNVDVDFEEKRVPGIQVSPMKCVFSK